MTGEQATAERVEPVPAGPVRARRGRDAVRQSAAVLAASARDPGLRAAQASFALAWLAEWAATVGIGIVAYRDGGALAVGLVGLARMLPAAVVGPFAAALADRVRRERVLLAVAGTRAVLFGGVAVLVAADAPLPVYALMVLAGAVGVLFRPAHSALLPSLCRTAHDLAGANAARGLLDSVAVFAGPLVATVLLALGSLSGVFVAAALMSAAAALCVLLVRYEPVPRDEPPGPLRLLADTRTGLAAVAAHPGLRVMFALAAAQTFVRGAFTVFAVVLAIDVLDSGEAAAGALTTAVGAGAVLGSLGASALAGSRHLAVWFGVGVALWGVPLALTAAAPGLAAAAALLAVVGVGNALLDVGVFTLPPRLVPDALLARVFAVLESVVSVSVAVGALAAPLLIELTGATAALVLVGMLPPAAVAAGWLGLRRLDAQMVEQDARVGLLASVPVLAPLPMPAIEHLAREVDHRTVPAGAHVVVQGEPGDAFFVLASGRADVVRDDELLRCLRPGDAFGEVALLRDTPRTASVRAVEQLEVWQVRRHQFVAAVQGCTRSAAEAEALMAGLRFVPEPRSAGHDR